jgi:hypothetical protein
MWLRSFDGSLETTHEGRVLAFIATNMGLPRVIRALNTGFVHSWGRRVTSHRRPGVTNPPQLP